MQNLLALGAGLGVCVAAGLAAVKWNAGVTRVAISVCCVVGVGVLISMKRSADSGWD